MLSRVVRLQTMTTGAMSAFMANQRAGSAVSLFSTMAKEGNDDYDKTLVAAYVATMPSSDASEADAFVASLINRLNNVKLSANALSAFFPTADITSLGLASLEIQSVQYTAPPPETFNAPPPPPQRGKCLAAACRLA